MFLYQCKSGHKWKLKEDLLAACPKCKDISTPYWCTTPEDRTYGYFECSTKSKTTLMGLDLGGESCGFKYMGKDASILMCPRCNQLNKAHKFVNDKRKEREDVSKEESQRGEGWGEPERVTHVRLVNGKPMPVTNHGKIKDWKDTKYASDRSGKRYAGYTNAFGEETKKAKGRAHRGDFK